MTVIRVRGFQVIKDRAGRPRYAYHRATRIGVDLEKAPFGSAEFFAACERITASGKAAEPKPGSLGLLIERYRGHSAFTDLAPRTRRDYDKHLHYLAPIADTALARFDRPLVVRIRDKCAESKGRKFANDVKARLSGLFAWGSERGFINGNPATGIKDIRRPRGLPQANRPWSDEERHAVLDAAPAQMRPALALMMYTGLAPKDALALPRNAYKDGEITTRRAKTDEPVFWQVPAMLTAIFEAAPPHSATTLCANSKGLPWTESGFRASWRTLRIRLDVEPQHRLDELHRPNRARNRWRASPPAGRRGSPARESACAASCGTSDRL
jgi:hypothetical protein